MMIYSVQYLRGIAALMVVLHHIEIKSNQYGLTELSSFHIGYFGVDLFFIISGFIMCHTTSEKKITFRQFMVARMKRILPLYWVVTSLALVVFLIMPQLINSSGGTTSIIASYLLLPTGDRFLVDNGWTLSYEFFFYLIFGLSFYIKTKGKGLIVCVVISALVTIGFIINSKNNIAHFMTNVLLLEFIMGMLAFYIWKNIEVNRTTSLILIICGLSIIIFENAYGVINTPFYRALNAGLPMLMIFIGAIKFEDLIRRKENILSKLAELIGNTSYSLYLIHPFVLSPAAMVLKKTGLTHTPYVFTCILLSSAVIAGWLCFKFIESPLNTWIKKHLRLESKNKQLI